MLACFVRRTKPPIIIGTKMKKLLLLLASFTLATVADAAYKDGTYQGEGDGLHGKITVSVDIKGGKITDVKVLKHSDTDMIIQAPIDNMIPEIIKKNGTQEVETVSGATSSSKGIQQAVQNALSKAK